MDSNITQLCRLCLQTSDDLLNIWEKFQDSTIASILEKHFWFQVNKIDGLTEWLCRTCWMQTKSFHEFYEKVETYQKAFWDYVKTDNGGANNDERVSIGPKDCAFEPDLSIVKCEVTELTTEGTDLKTKKRNSSNSISDGNNKSGPIKPKSRHSSTVENRTASDSLSRAEKEGQDAQIIEFFSMKCDICTTDVEFDSLLKVRQHYRKVHKTTGYLTCCGKKFERRHLMLSHIRYHVNPDAYRCEECGKGFHVERALKLHIGNHVPIDSRAFKCNLCPSSFGRQSALKNHVKSKHTSKTGELFPCDRCGKSFRSNLLLTSHIRMIHEYTSGHVCEICARQFKTKQTLQTHFENEHSETPRPKLQCNICGAWLKHKRDLIKHLQRHQDINDANVETFKCTICDKVAPNKHALSGHMRSVHIEERHVCTLCSKSFKRAKNLKEHMAWHTGEDLYDCAYCEKKFKSNANMYSHRKKAHLAEWTRDFPQRTPFQRTSTNEEIEAQLNTLNAKFK